MVYGFQLNLKSGSLNIPTLLKDVYKRQATPAKVESRPVSLEPVAEVTPEESVDAVPTEESYFDGRLLQLIGWRLITFFVSLITLGLALPWACLLYTSLGN